MHAIMSNHLGSFAVRMVVECSDTGFDSGGLPYEMIGGDCRKM